MKHIAGLVVSRGVITSRKRLSQASVRCCFIGIATRQGHHKYDQRPAQWLPAARDPLKRLKNTSPQLSPEASAIQRALRRTSAHPAEVIHDQITEGKPTVEVIRTCLEAYKTKLFADCRRSKRIDVVRAKAIGGEVLNYLFEDRELCFDAAPKDYVFLELLCYFGVAEGLENMLMEWLMVDIPADVAVKHTERSAVVWRGILLRSIVDAHVVLDSDRRADEALRCFITAFKEREIGRARLLGPNGSRLQALPLTLTFSLDPAMFSLVRELTSGQYWRTNAHLYDEFERAHEMLPRKRDRPNWELARAHLRLYHPKEPDPTQAISFVRNYFCDRPIEEARSRLAQTKPALRLFERFAKRASKIAKDKGHYQDAEMLSRVAQGLGLSIESDQCASLKVDKEQTFVNRRSDLG